VQADDLQHNKFYMVAPFIGQLKGWIKQQRRNDSMKSGLNAPEPVLVEDSGFETDYPTHDGLIAADAPEVAENSNAGDGHLQFLLARLGQSQVEAPLPQPSAASSAKTDQLALELKKLLSVGSAASMPAPTEKPAPPVRQQGNSLMALLQPGGPQAHPPLTPIEQIETSPPQALTPHHHNKPPHISELSPPPTFPYSAVSDNMNRPRHTFSFANTLAPVYNAPPQQHAQFPTHPAHPPHPTHQIHPAHPAHLSLPPHQPHPSHIPHPAQPPAPFVAPQPFPSNVHQPQQFMPHPHAVPLTQRPLQPQQTSQFSPRGVALPSNLPAQRLSQHNIALLNTFKSGTPNVQPHAVSPVAHSLELPSENLDPIGRDRATENAPSAPTQHPQQNPQTNPNSLNGQGPRTVQQKTLLGLFRNPDTAQATSSSAGLAPPVAELSAGTPQNSVTQSPIGHVTIQKTHERVTISRDGAIKTKTKLTSATVSGPLNAPDFETVQRNRPPAELGNGSENAHSPVPVHTVGSSIVLEAPRPFHPSTILQRQQQFTPTNLAGPSSETPREKSVSSATFDRRDAQPASQKSTLMSLFGSGGSKQAAGMPPVPMSVPRHPSLNGSPVSPLPDRRVPVKSQPTTIEPLRTEKIKSRVSSFDIEGQGQASAKNQSPITPIEKRFLFQYLEGVVSQDTKE
jgi:mRNA-decapping enzyme subunit 2